MLLIPKFLSMFVYIEVASAVKSLAFFGSMR